MRKQVRQYLRRSLCGVLSAAMILTGSSISGMTVYAEEVGQTNDADGGTDATPSEENKDVIQNPNAGDGNADGNESDTGDSDTGKEDENTQKQPGDVSEEDDVTTDENINPDDEEKDGDLNDDNTEDDNITDADSTDGAAGDENLEDAPDKKVVLGAEDGVYEDVTVEFNYYVGELNAGETVGFYKWGTSITVDEGTNPKL